MAENPPWADKIINKYWKKIESAANELGLPMPKHVASGEKRKPTEELGCAHYGCVWRSEKPGIAVKLTTDQTEAHTIASTLYLKQKKDFETEGMIRFYAVLAIQEESHRGRPIFIIWREEAEKVGLPFRVYGGGDRDMSEFSKLLSRFKETAHEARMISVNEMKKISERRIEIAGLESEIERSSKSGIPEYANKPLKKKLEKLKAKDIDYWAWMKSQLDKGDKMAEEFNEHWGETFGDYNVNDKVGAAIMRRHKGWPDRFAWLTEAAHQIGVEMANANQYAYLVGKALVDYMDEGLFLADVHHNNVGTVKREGYGDSIWVITDPGHAIVLKESMSEIGIPKL